MVTPFMKIDTNVVPPAIPPKVKSPVAKPLPHFSMPPNKTPFPAPFLPTHQPPAHFMPTHLPPAHFLPSSFKELLDARAVAEKKILYWSKYLSLLNSKIAREARKAENAKSD